MSEPLSPMAELVRNAIGYGVMMALEGRDELVSKLQRLGPTGSLADALTADAEGFIRTRSDLVEAVKESPRDRANRDGRWDTWTGEGVGP